MCDRIKSNKPGFEASAQIMLHNTILICVSWEHLRIRRMHLRLVSMKNELLGKIIR